MAFTRRGGPRGSSDDEGSSPHADSRGASSQQHLLHKGSRSSPALGGASAATTGRSFELEGGQRGGASCRTLLWTLLGLFGAAMLLSRLGGSGHRHQSFVRVEGSQLTLECRPFYIAGFNVDNIAQAANPAIARKLGSGAGGLQAVRAVFQQAAAAGLNVVRTFAHTTDPQYPLQVRPGQYDEGAFRGLDGVIAEAERAGLRVILSLVDNWKYYGGVDEFVDWSSTVPQRDPKFPPVNRLGDASVEDYSPEQLAYENRRKVLFYTDPTCRQMYKDHVRAVLERRNSYTGKRYKEDPAILAFNLINEPRCSAYETPECTDTFQHWVHDMSTHFKALDQRHLLGVGSEGFFGERDAQRSINPGAPGSDWASKSGQDFIATNQVAMIDFATVHLWPDNWKEHNQTFQQQWVDKHIDDCGQLLKKPCVLEEFGKALGRGQNPPAEVLAQQRDPVFVAAYEAVERGMGQGRAVAGSLYWRWGLNVYRNDVPGPYGVLPGHSTFQLASQHAQRVRAHMTTRPPRQECQLDCWVPQRDFFSLLRRCEHSPSVCSEQRARQQYQKSALDESGRKLAPQGSPVFATQAECCLPGLGGFERGCTTSWF